MSTVASRTFRSTPYRDSMDRSRYADADEMELMLDMLAALTDEQLGQIREIYCDSKRGNDFLVLLSQWDPKAALATGETLERVTFERSHGHSGIMLRHGEILGDGPYIEIEPDYDGE